MLEHDLVRKQQSERMLREHGIPMDPGLKYVEDFQFRSPQEVARRALVLHALLGVIFYHRPLDVVEWVREEGLWEELTPREKEIFQIPLIEDEGERVWKLRRMQSNRITWRMEALWALLWSLGKIETLGWPSGQSDAEQVGNAVPQLGESTESFIENAEFRPLSEIADQADLMFRLFHGLQRAREENSEAPAGVEPFTVYEWHLALQWIFHDWEWEEMTG
ncbi:DUF4272 domain-containing protein [Kroppenstedtia eburnea]|uniref:DUF4272 domain-containing protein n=1 Tax=Kroppenstedtia eburnea TaxID=714067 RepID=UPI00363E0114